MEANLNQDIDLKGKMEAVQSSFWDFKGTVPYVDEWFMMGSPFLMLMFLSSYLFFVLRCGPKFMQNRPAFKLRKILLLYNALQVAFAFYIFYIGAEIIFFEVGLIERKCAFDDESKKFRILRGTHIYLMIKLSELLDTVFFVLRKKWNQVSFLHVYHHTFMFFFSWIGLKYEPSYSLVFLGTLNSFVHVIMYTYYGLSAFPRLQKYLWWKKYITKLQLIQFALILVQMTWNFMVAPCPPSYKIMTLCWSHTVFFTFLFTKFYFEAYRKRRDMDKADLKAKNMHKAMDESMTSLKDSSKSQ